MNVSQITVSRVYHAEALNQYGLRLASAEGPSLPLAMEAARAKAHDELRRANPNWHWRIASVREMKF